MAISFHRAQATLLGGLLLIGVTACGSGGGREEFIDTLQEEGASAEQANCMADALEGEVAFDNAGDPNYQPTDEEAEAMFTAISECAILE